MLFSLFLGLTIFGGVVTLMDLLMGFGSHHDSHHDSGGDSHGTDGHLAHADDSGHGIEAQGTQANNHEHAEQPFDGSLRVKDRDAGNSLYRVISFLRRSVYFSLGAGGAGLAAIVTGTGELMALAWSGVAGLGTLGILSLVRRLQRQELDSTVSEEELLYETGEVVVSILPGQMGKIRLKGKGSVVERYAQAANPSSRFPTGAVVRVSEVQKDLLIVIGHDEDYGQ